MKFDYNNVPLVPTKYGQLQGYSVDDTYIFEGITYAEAERFQAPKEPTPWEGVKEATSYGFVCPLLQQETPAAEIMVPHRYWPQSEHCQNLNVWTQSLDKAAKKPVMVWLHGGGYTAGSSIEQVSYDGKNMSSLGDVVVVSVNHRLNIVGYLDLSPFGEKYKNSANAGHADLVAALKWVNENIENFGGDPENVTIFGQSGGGLKVSALMQIPSAAGLFSKGIIMSGVVGDLLPMPKGDGKKIVSALLQELNIPVGEIEALEKVPYQTLASAYNKVSPQLAMAGENVGCAPMENDFFVGQPQDTVFTEQAKNTPLMVGTVFGEFAFAPATFNKKELSAEEKIALVKERFGEYTDKVIELFTKAYPDKCITDVFALDTLFRTPTKQLIEAKSKHSQAPTYSYLFTFEFPYQHGKPAWHCADIPFFFHNIDKVPICNVAGVSDKLEEQIFASVINFAYTGNPNHAELPQWDPCLPNDENVMIFDRTCEIRNNFDDELIAFIKEISPPFSLAAMFANNEVQH